MTKNLAIFVRGHGCILQTWSQIRTLNDKSVAREKFCGLLDSIGENFRGFCIKVMPLLKTLIHFAILRKSAKTTKLFPCVIFVV